MTAVAGVKLGVAQAGIKKPNRDDLTVIALAEGTTTAALFTQNAFCAAPVTVARDHWLASGQRPRYWLINTGNANAGTGAPGMAAALESCAGLAARVGVETEQVMPFSTGVIGELLPVSRLLTGLDHALEDLSEDGWTRAASAIMTTDTRPKLFSRSLTFGDTSVTLTGITKGAGMICPNMATMLSFVATDAGVPEDVLQKVFAEAVRASFNRVTVDGDTSTNDAAVMAATGHSQWTWLEGTETERNAFTDALLGLCIDLAHALVRDGEGATKFVTLAVSGGRDEDECLAVAYTIAHSPLVKTALFASDPNWGRLLAAIGRAGLADLIVEDVTVSINGVLIAENGARSVHYTEEQGVAAMAPEDITIAIGLKRGGAEATVWTTDLSYDYVKINAEYRT